MAARRRPSISWNGRAASAPDLTLDAGHVYRYRGEIVPGNTEVLRAFGLIPEQASQVYLGRGTAAHRATQLADERDLNWARLDPGLIGYVEGWLKLKSHGFEPTLIEVPLFNKTWRFATTLDRAGYWRGDPAIMEIKTGEIEPYVGLQTAAQALCLDIEVRRFAVHLPGDGTFDLIECKDKLDRGAFLGLLAAYNWRRRHR